MLSARQHHRPLGAVALASLLRQLQLRFLPPARRLGVDFTLQLDGALAPLLLLDAPVLQQLLMHMLGLVLPAYAQGRVELKVQVWAQQHMRQILTLELSASQHGEMAGPSQQQSGPARAGKPRQERAGWCYCRQLARRLGADLRLEHDGQHLHACVQLSPTMAGEDTLPLQASAGCWPVLLLCADAAQGRHIQQQLQETAYPLETVSTVAAALQRWQQQAVAALLLVDPLTETNLSDLLTSIRSLETAQPWRGHTPLLAVLPQHTSESAWPDATPDGWLSQPVAAAALQAWLPECAGSSPAVLPVLDRKVLSDLSQGDWAVELPLLQGYLRDKQADLILLLQAWQQGDLPTCVALAHRIKGASRTVGAARLAATAASLEQAARAGQGDSLPGMLLTLEQALEDFALHLQTAGDC